MNFKTYLPQYKTSFIFVVLSVLMYLSFAYNLSRNNYATLIFLYTALFVLFYKLITTNHDNFNFLVIISFLFRLLFLFAIPNLSQDFYRFIWDGRMILEGFNPYLFTPESFINSGEFPIVQAKELYTGMGELNGSHFTNYPPINQFSFVIAGIIAGKSILGSVVVMRILIIFADVGILFFGKKLLQQLNIPNHHIFWYLLNPFIIIELTGNLHFESVMLFFLIWSLYLLQLKKWRKSAIVFALSVSVKLIPLIFLPLFLQKLGWKKSIYFYSIIGFLTLMFFAPFYSSNFIPNYAQTVALWFQNFEFNASIYYIIRELSYKIRGWNEIAIIGKILPLVVVVVVFIIAFYRKNKTTKQLITAMLMMLSFYYFTATTVHPWYLATLVLLSIYTKYIFPLVWSFVIIFSYLAYANTKNTENLYIIALEYIVIYGVLFWELFLRKYNNKRQMLQL
ncbi:MAG: mannosyltransferase [Flavobacteriaceae bacterium]|nr:mannosyltransferase [Flavobacteriaceae bacterium]